MKKYKISHSIDRYLKKISFLNILIVSIILCCNDANAQIGIDKVKRHPYLFYTDDRIKEVKKKIKEDTAMRNAWQAMFSRADAAVSSGKGGDMEVLSFAYRMTGEKKYAMQAKKILLELAGKKAWDGLDDRTPRWNAALGTAHYNAMTATVYDAIYDALTQEERKTIAGAIVSLGIRPSLEDWLLPGTRMHTLNTMGHNWWSAIVHEAGIASLAVMTEVPEAKQWAQETMASSKEWIAFSGDVLENKVRTFDPAGGTYEGINYTNFAVGEYLFFRLAWTNAVGAIRMPYDSLLVKTMDWFIQMSYPTNDQLMSVNFGDGNLHINGERAVKLMMALGFHKKYYDWYLSETKRSREREDLNISTPMGLLYSPVIKNHEPLPEIPTSAVYSDMGWASLRNSWKENATMLAVKSGFTWNHAHADAGSFVLFHNGKNLLIDGGNVNYGNHWYSDYSVRSEAHNVILFNDKAQEPQDEYFGVKNRGHLYHLMDGGNIKYILSDATGPTARYFLRNFRNILWIGNVILLLDDLKTYDPGKLSFLLHTSVPVKTVRDDLEVKDSNASVLVKPLFPETLPIGFPHDFPEKMQLEERPGIKDHDADSRVPYYAISPPNMLQQTDFITAIILLDSNKSNVPTIERLQGENMNGVRITQNGYVTDVYFNLLAAGKIMHRNCINVMNGWQTDAYILAATYKDGADINNAGNINGYFVSNGSFVRRNNKVLFNSLSKVFMIAQQKDNHLDVVLQGEPVINMSLTMKAAQVTLNGVSVTPGREGDKLIFKIND